MILKFYAQNKNNYECDLMMKFENENYSKVASLGANERKKVQLQTNKTSGLVYFYVHPLDSKYFDSEIISINVEEETFYFLTSEGENVVTSDGLTFEVKH